MLSYRHGFHAGNHADVVKHWIQTLLIGHLAQKEKPFWYIDTHSGAGCYALDSQFSSKNAEYRDGIARLWQDPALPEVFHAYRQAVLSCCPGDQLSHYPGSPLIAAALLPASSRLRLFELHPADHATLQQVMQPYARRCLIQQSDGFSGIRALLPPPPRRALVLIDPPYEQKDDYRRVVLALQEASKRFATGVYAIWYPLLQRPEQALMVEQLEKSGMKSWLNLSLQVRAPARDGFGMHGSGMFIVNPPWTLHQTLEAHMPWLTKMLAQDKQASYRIKHAEG